MPETGRVPVATNDCFVDVELEIGRSEPRAALEKTDGRVWVGLRRPRRRTRHRKADLQLERPDSRRARQAVPGQFLPPVQVSAEAGRQCLRRLYALGQIQAVVVRDVEQEALWIERGSRLRCSIRCQPGLVRRRCRPGPLQRQFELRRQDALQRRWQLGLAVGYVESGFANEHRREVGRQKGRPQRAVCLQGGHRPAYRGGRADAASNAGRMATRTGAMSPRWRRRKVSRNALACGTGARSKSESRS